MAIKFVCPHTGCDKLIQVPDSLAGAEDRCPRCGRAVTIPEAAGEFGYKDEAYIRAITAPRRHPSAGMTLPRDSRQSSRCRRCGRLMSVEATECPFCGAGAAHPTEAAQPGAAATSSRTTAVSPVTGSYLRSCIGAARYVLKTAPAGLVLVAGAGLLHGLVMTAAVLCAGEGGGRCYLSAGLAGIAVLAAAGYFGRFCVGVIEGTLRGREAAKLPSANPISTLLSAAKLIQLAAVYVVPLVTLPLLPVGLLALACTGDRRAWDVPRTARSAGRCAEDLALLWLMILPAAGLAAIAGVVLMRLVGSLAAAVSARMPAGWSEPVRISVLSAGAMIPAAVVVVLSVALCRCVGMLGRHNAELVRLPRGLKRSAAGAVCLLAGLVVSAALAAAIVLRGVRG